MSWEFGLVTIDLVRAATHSDDLPNTSATAGPALNPSLRENFVFHYWMTRHDTGEIRWMLAYGEGSFDDVTGDGLGYVGTLQDATGPVGSWTDRGPLQT
ncbi:MAG: signal transduction histidine kinase [Devosia sp.]|nr:signal transduction histidine kinase [Devosia sp.]